jgi:DNA-binding NtrC family response regulator
VLIVDDEEHIRDVGLRILDHFGYRGVGAASAEEALRLYRESAPPFDLVLLDLGLPGMGGEECLEQLMEMDPRCRVVVTSGCDDLKAHREYLAKGAKFLLPKPYGLETLMTVIREVLKD